MLHILQELEKHAGSLAASVALRSVGSSKPIRWTQRQLHEQVSNLAQLLELQIIQGGTILLCCPNQPAYLVAFLAILASRRIVFPVSSDSTAPELASISQASSPAAAIADKSQLPLLSGLFGRTLPFNNDLVLLSDPRSSPIIRDGPALLLQSSGTTARPKLVFRDAASLDAVTRNIVSAWRFTADDHVLAAVPLCHSYGLEHGILAPVTAGSCIHIVEKFDLGDVLHEFRHGGITIFPGVPFMFEMLCRASQERFPSLRLAFSAGGPLSSVVVTEFAQKFGVAIGQVYGATEIGSVTFNDPMSHRFHSASVGCPMNGVRIAILDPDSPQMNRPMPPQAEGVIAVSAPSMFGGYLDGSRDSIIDGYFLTGDLGFLNAEGFLTLTGRQKLLIDVGGKKVNPLEVESVLCSHPDVASALVFPLRVSESIQRLKAIIAPANPDATIQIRELRRFARERLSAYKVPRVFEIRAQLPLTAAGKIQRRMVESQ